MCGRGRAGGVIQVAGGPVGGRARAGREILIGSGPVGRRAVQRRLAAALAVSGRVAAGRGGVGGGGGGEEEGRGGHGGGGEGAVQRRGGRRHEGAGLEAPQQLLVVHAQPLLLRALLLHRLVQVGVLLRQLPAGGGKTTKRKVARVVQRFSGTETETVPETYLEMVRFIWI